MKPSLSNEELRLRRLTRRGFLTGGLAFAAAGSTSSWVYNAKTEDGIPWPFQRPGFQRAAA